jgi:hypothetical protein
MLDTVSTISETVSVKKNRCETCKKKLGLMPFSCRCGGLFCVEHRADIAHNCSYDYQEENKKKLGDLLIKVAGQKLDKL